MRLSSNTSGDNETNFPNTLLLTNRQVSNLSKDFARKSSTDGKLSKTQLSKMIQSGFLGRFLGPLLKTGLPLIKNTIKLLAKRVLIPLGLTSAASAADARIHKKILASGNHASRNNTATLIISNDEMVYDYDLWLKGVSETVQNEVKEQKGGFLSMIVGTLGANLVGNILAGKGINRAGEGAIVKRQGQGIVRAGHGNKEMGF